jgi:hypothetical protein
MRGAFSRENLVQIATLKKLENGQEEHFIIGLNCNPGQLLRMCEPTR